MPIKICDEWGNEKAWLCDDNWNLPDQISVLEQWLRESGTDLKPGEWVTDIGFTVRADAGGGGALSPEAMGIMSKIGMWLYLSEYPQMEDEDVK